MRKPNIFVMTLSRELSDLEPVVAPILDVRDKEKERADLAALLADPALDREMRVHGRPTKLAAAETPLGGDGAGDPDRAPAEGRGRRRRRDPRGAGRHRRRRGGAVRRRPLPYVRQIRRKKAGRSRCCRSSEGDPRATRKSSPRSLVAACSRIQVRERRAPRAARARDPGAGAHPHLGRHRGGFAGSRRRSSSPSTKRDLKFDTIVPAARAASTSTRRNPRPHRRPPHRRVVAMQEERSQGRNRIRPWRCSARECSTPGNQKLYLERASARALASGLRRPLASGSAPTLSRRAG